MEPTGGTELVTCRACGGESPADARFCIECGESMASATGPTTRLELPTCASCGAPNVADARFCAICGRPLAQASAVGSPWAQPSAASRPAPRPYAPPPPRPYAPPPSPAPMPRLATPPQLPAPAQAHPHHAPPPPRAHHRAHRHGGPPPAAVVMVIGIGVLAAMHALTLPLVLLVLGAAFVVQQAERGRLDQGLRTVMMVAAGLFVLSNPRAWPVLIVAFGLLQMFRRRTW